MCSGITTLARIGKRKELRFVNMTYEEVRKIYEQRANRRFDSPGAFTKDNGGNGNEYYNQKI
ncbi:MAG: hypothetical protein QM220_02110 [Atribacterota bacterium]|nr:hypothetical protein [Atribacterota bacterium]